MPDTRSHPLARFRSEFPIFERAVYLNTCSLGALSRRSRARVTELLDTWDARGAPAWYDVWWESLEALRAGYARVIGADPHAIALHPSISSALGVLASAVAAPGRPRVVVTELDFPTVAYQWLARRPSGVEVEVVPSHDGATVSLAAIADAVDDRTAIVATSHVFYSTGAIQDLAALADIAHRRGALLVVDGYQAAGQLPVDVQSLGIDCYLGGGLKWLLGGPGIAFLFVREDLHGRLVPQTTGWFAHRDQFAFDPVDLAFHDDARRFETGTPALAAVYAQLGGLEVLEAMGWEAVREVTRHLTVDLIAQAEAHGLRLRVAARPEERSAIVMVAREDPAADVRRLARAGFIVDARPGHVRFSPYCYNLQEDHVAALAELAAVGP